MEFATLERPATVVLGSATVAHDIDDGGSPPPPPPSFRSGDDGDRRGRSLQLIKMGDPMGLVYNDPLVEELAFALAEVGILARKTADDGRERALAKMASMCALLTPANRTRICRFATRHGLMICPVTVLMAPNLVVAHGAKDGALDKAQQLEQVLQSDERSRLETLLVLTNIEGVVTIANLGLSTNLPHPTISVLGGHDSARFSEGEREWLRSALRRFPRPCTARKVLLNALGLTTTRTMDLGSEHSPLRRVQERYRESWERDLAEFFPEGPGTLHRWLREPEASCLPLCAAIVSGKPIDVRRCAPLLPLNSPSPARFDFLTYVYPRIASLDVRLSQARVERGQPDLAQQVLLALTWDALVINAPESGVGLLSWAARQAAEVNLYLIHKSMVQAGEDVNMELWNAFCVLATVEAMRRALDVAESDVGAIASTLAWLDQGLVSWRPRIETLQDLLSARLTGLCEQFELAPLDLEDLLARIEQLRSLCTGPGDTSGCTGSNGRIASRRDTP